MGYDGELGRGKESDKDDMRVFNLDTEKRVLTIKGKYNAMKAWVWGCYGQGSFIWDPLMLT